MTAPHDRRGFLRGLAALPLIGGSVAIIGRPSAVAEPVSIELLEAYKTWLHYERRSLCWEIADRPEARACGADRVQRCKTVEAYNSHGLHPLTKSAGAFHSLDGVDPASARAALVLSTVGCDWQPRQGGAHV